MSTTSSVAVVAKRPRGRPPIPIVEYPDPLWEAEAPHWTFTAPWTCR